MQLNQLSVTNFRCYKNEKFNFHPQFNLIVGQNATGKTAVLDAVSIAIATWLMGFKKKNDKKGLKWDRQEVSEGERERETQTEEISNKNKTKDETALR